MKKRFTYPIYMIAAVVALAATVIILVLGVADVLGWKRTEATVIERDGSVVKVEYTDQNDVVHTNLPIGSTFAGKVGSKMLIRYKVDHPEEIDALGVNIILGVAVGMAAMLLGALAGIFWRTESKEAKGKQAALSDGHPVECNVMSIVPEPTLRFGKEPAYVRLDCVPVDLTDASPEDIVVYTSERFVNPHRPLAGTVTVIVNNQDPTKYYVDLDTLKLDEVQPEADPTI